MPIPVRSLRRAAIFCVMLGASALCAQQTATPEAEKTTPDEPKPVLTLFPHPDEAPYLLSGQANIIFQAHPGFHSPYSDANSLLARGEYKTSMVGTLFLGYALNHDKRYETDFVYDEESSGGRGVSEALGAGGVYELGCSAEPAAGVDSLHGAGADSPDDRLYGQDGRRTADAVFVRDEGAPSVGWTCAWAR